MHKLSLRLTAAAAISLLTIVGAAMSNPAFAGGISSGF